LQWFSLLPGWAWALVATCFTWLMTALGALPVLFYKKTDKSAFCFMLSASAGIMLASSFFSLLLPAVENFEGNFAFLWLTLGFVTGGLLIVICDLCIKLLNGNKGDGERKSCANFCIAVTIHNIPEGLAVGVAFGVAGQGYAAAMAAVMLAVGIGIQNFPEGMCVAFPLRANGASRKKSFFLGQLSGAVEVIAGVLGALAVTEISGILPFALAFSSGAMVAVVCSELVPESFAFDKLKATFGVIFGFAVMMLLDLAFG